jgi:hypothetical protein
VNDIDASTWGAIGITLSLVGLVVSFLLWRRSGAATGIRAAAWSLLPAAAGLTGTLRLLWQVGDLVVAWALRLVFSPVVWVGIVLAAVAAVLFAVSAVMRARGFGTSRRQRRGQRTEALPGQRSGGAAPAVQRPAKRSEPPAQDKDLDDIEAILRKHGIS